MKNNYPNLAPEPKLTDHPVPLVFGWFVAFVLGIAMTLLAYNPCLERQAETQPVLLLSTNFE